MFHPRRLGHRSLLLLSPLLRLLLLLLLLRLLRLLRLLLLRVLLVLISTHAAHYTIEPTRSSPPTSHLRPLPVRLILPRLLRSRALLLLRWGRLVILRCLSLHLSLHLVATTHRLPHPRILWTLLLTFFGLVFPPIAAPPSSSLSCVEAAIASNSTHTTSTVAAPAPVGTVALPVVLPPASAILSASPLRSSTTDDVQRSRERADAVQRLRVPHHHIHEAHGGSPDAGVAAPIRFSCHHDGLIPPPELRRRRREPAEALAREVCEHTVAARHGREGQGERGRSPGSETLEGGGEGCEVVLY